MASNPRRRARPSQSTARSPSEQPTDDELKEIERALAEEEEVPAGEAQGLAQSATPPRIPQWLHGGQLQTVPLKDIVLATPFQLRLMTRELATLKTSMKAHGQNSPVTLHSERGSDHLVVVDGHSRVQAARELEWKSIGARVFVDLSLEEIYRLAHGQNRLQSSYTDNDSAKAVWILREKEQFTISKIATILELEVWQVKRLSKRLEFSEGLKSILDNKYVFLSHLYVLHRARVVDHEQAEAWARRIRDDKLTVEELEKLLKTLKKQRGRPPGPRRLFLVRGEMVRIPAAKISLSEPTEKLRPLIEQAKALVALLEGAGSPAARGATAGSGQGGERNE
jgi:ParB-like chromosome segregation protein Spo0J